MDSIRLVILSESNTNNNNNNNTNTTTNINTNNLIADGGSVPVSRCIGAARKGGDFVHYRARNNRVHLAYAYPVSGTNLIVVGALPVPRHSSARATMLADDPQSSDSQSNAVVNQAPFFQEADFGGPQSVGVTRQSQAMAPWGGMGVINGWRPNAATASAR